MNTTSTTSRNPGRGRHALIVLALALTAMLLGLGAPVANAAPPPEVHASENPVVLPVNKDWKEISFWWTPDPGAQLSVKVTEDGKTVGTLWGWPDYGGPAELTVKYGKTYTIQIENRITHEFGPLLTITSKRPPVPASTFAPKPPEVNITPQPRIPVLLP